MTTARRGGRLLADVGGTNARFAWQSGAGAPIEAPIALPTADHPTLADAMRAYLARSGRTAPGECAIAIATAVLGDHVRMTNHAWSFSIAALQAEFGFERLRVLNDFTALALALPSLAAHERRQLGGGEPVPRTAIGLIGPGTGLGVSGLIPDGRGGWIPLEGEGGHVTLPARTDRERAVLRIIGARYGHPSAERAVSGAGLVDLHLALCQIDGEPPGDRDAAAITASALAGDDSLCAEAVELFCAFLGTAAGNLALTLGARGGVYIGGGIVPRLGPLLDRSPFRTRFDSKGRFAPMLSAIPVYVIQADESPAFRGAARALDTP